MCGGGSKPKPPPIPAILPEAPQAAGRVEVTKDSDDERRRRAGHSGTILTGARGLIPSGNSGGTQVKAVLGG